MSKNSKRKAINKRDGNLIEISKIEFQFLQEQNEQLKVQNKELQTELKSYKGKSTHTSITNSLGAYLLGKIQGNNYDS